MAVVAVLLVFTLLLSNVESINSKPPRIYDILSLIYQLCSVDVIERKRSLNCTETFLDAEVSSILHHCLTLRHVRRHIRTDDTGDEVERMCREFTLVDQWLLKHNKPPRKLTKVISIAALGRIVCVLRGVQRPLELWSAAFAECFPTTWNNPKRLIPEIEDINRIPDSDSSSLASLGKNRKLFRMSNLSVAVIPMVHGSEDFPAEVKSQQKTSTAKTTQSNYLIPHTYATPITATTMATQPIERHDDFTNSSPATEVPTPPMKQDDDDDRSMSSTTATKQDDDDRSMSSATATKQDDDDRSTSSATATKQDDDDRSMSSTTATKQDDDDRSMSSTTATRVATLPADPDESYEMSTSFQEYPATQTTETGILR